MARGPDLPAVQLRALDRLSALPGIERFYLAGGTAIAFHLGHRRSRDIDLFGPADASFSAFQSLARAPSPARARVVRVGEATLQMVVGSVPVDVVRFPYPLLRRTTRGPGGVRVAGLLDLATNKLAAITKRGLQRDFWDLYAIAQSGISLESACRAYVKRFGVSESDLYHVATALTWFEEATKERPPPVGMSARLWREIREYFEARAPKLLRARRRG